MARPTLTEVFGQGAVVSAPNPAVGAPGDFRIPLTTVFGENAVPPGGGDAQRMLIRIIQFAAQRLNESNRNNDRDDTRLTITYGEYDNLQDPPGSGTVVRRDVWSVLTYQDVAYVPFDPDNV